MINKYTEINIDNVLYVNCTMYRTHKKAERGSVTSNKPNNISTGSDPFFEVGSLIVSPSSEKPKVLVPDPNHGCVHYIDGPPPP